jgi:polar amino acid transport system substrate-binding protein
VAEAATTAPVQDRPLRVVTAATAPFVLPKTNPPAGFSIDLWNEVARRMRVDFTWRVVPTEPELLQAVQHGDADVAIAAIAMTPEREKVVDFSHPYFDSGLQIMVRTQDEGAFLTTLHSIPWLAIGQLFGAAIIIIFILANVLWLIERRKINDYSKSYLRAIGEGVWRTMLIIATIDFGDRKPSVVQRVTVVLMWLMGVVLIAQFTATVTSSQTVQRLQSSVRGPDDLPGKTIASVPGSIAGDYLTQRGLNFVSVSYGPDAIRMLIQGEVQAVVFDAPTLQYWVAKRGNGVVQVVGPVFRPEKYGIALAEGSLLRKPINEALLELYNDGTYEEIHARWLSQGK